MNTNNLFYEGPTSKSERIIYTPSSFARTSLLYLQECGTLTALKPHVSSRTNLPSELFFTVLSGSGWLTYEGVKYRLGAGDVVWIPCVRGYEQSSSEDLWELKWCHFNGSNMSALFNKYTERGGKPVFHPQVLDPFITILDQIYATASSDSHIRDVELNCLLNELLSLLFLETVYDEYDEGKARQREIRSDEKKINISEMKSYIDTHYSAPLSLTFLANHFYISKHYLARIFKERYGVSVGTYIGIVRIGKAKEMLRFSSVGIESIGMACGYGEQNYFSRVFKKVEGCSPSEYRKRWKGRN